ncbi:MAG: Na+/H+ antiporter NhaC family protein [Lachnospiraceae bacterium]|nr:Na+/H+ antiporter NhaC family protein [Lachnospiraceae bacterium]
MLRSKSRSLNAKRYVLALFVVAIVCGVGLSACKATGSDAAEIHSMVGTFWALLPPLVAIILALITHEVYISLFAGVVVAGLFYANFNIPKTMTAVVKDGLIGAIADEGHVGILLFLVILGIMVILLNKAGGSAAFAEWTMKRIKTRRGALLSTFALSCVIAIDDYFNVLTVGNVMRPVTDTHHISRAKLAYMIDATAAPICMIAPISSWAAAVSSSVEGTALEGINGIEIFVRSIPYNFYSLMTILMILTLAILGFDYGPMRKHEKNAIEKNDLFTTDARPYKHDGESPKAAGRAKVIDLFLPILVLIIFCVLGLLYTGGFFHGVSLIDAFADCDASYGLPIGAGIALILTYIYLLCRRTINFKDSMSCIPDGFKAMVPSILILVLAWALTGVTKMLGAATFVKGVMENISGSLQLFLPAIIFVIAAFIGFATGSSWGTFGILIPIVVPLFEANAGNLPPMLLMSIAACCAGGVCGDHCSPISDTTIMSSAGAHCDHINHVQTQLPYALTVVAVSFIGYIIAGLTQSLLLALPITTVLMIGVLFLIRAAVKKAEAKEALKAKQ